MTGKNDISTPSADAVLKMMGLDLSLDDLESSSEPECDKTPSSLPVHLRKTPNIDAVLAKTKRQKHTDTSGLLTTCDEFLEVTAISSSGDNKGNRTESCHAAKNENAAEHEERLKHLEEQLANLVSTRQEAENNKENNRKTCARASSSSTRSTPMRGKKKTVSLSKAEKHDVPQQDKATYFNLVKELESERERRWKSEQAARRLAKLVRDVSMEKAEGKSLQDMAAKTADRLKQALVRERENTDSMKKELLEYEQKITEMSAQMDDYQKTIGEQQSAMKALETTVAKETSHHGKILAVQSKKLHEYEMRISSSSRDAEIYKSQNAQLRQRLSELQEILVTREQDYKRGQEKMFSADSKEFRDAVSDEINRQEKRHKEDTRMLQQTIATLRRQYGELEEEFRQALHIEADRFGKTDSQYQQCTDELQRLQSSYHKIKERDEKSRSIVAELTAVAKEQKSKITELSKNKHEIIEQYKDRISNLEITAEDGRRKGVQLELIKQEKSRLVSQLAAVQSVVDGLRDERKLWGHELAQQGASLAQDRGRLESRIDTLNQELATMRKQNDRDLDALKIKSKIVDDQTETIHKMKDALVEKDAEIANVQEHSLAIQRKLEQDVEDLTQDNAALNEQVQALLERKRELKSQLSDTENDLEASRQSYSKLVKKWADKGQVLSRVETQVKQMKEAYDRKEKKLLEEKEEAMKGKQLLTARLERIDTAFREQLEAANAAHDEEMLRMRRNNENEVEAMRRKIASVEEEMREVLRDAERQKKGMEEKLKRVTLAFKELQDGFD